MDRAIIIVDHGSRRAAANAVVVEIARLVQLRAGPGVTVHWAHMEIEEPSLPEVIDACVEGGARTIVVVPLFLAPGRHAQRDIPELVVAAESRHPSVTFEMGEVLGADPLLVELVSRRCGF